MLTQIARLNKQYSDNLVTLPNLIFICHVPREFYYFLCVLLFYFCPIKHKNFSIPMQLRHFFFPSITT